MSRTKHRAELLYRYLIIATKRLTDRQLMILLAIVVGLAAGLATYVFQHTLEFFRFSLTSWFAFRLSFFRSAYFLFVWCLIEFFSPLLPSLYNDKN